MSTPVDDPPTAREPVPVPSGDDQPADPPERRDGDADQAERRARASQSFWTLVVGVPAVFSVLRLAVEAGGELQTTLLLVANVGPVNLIAGFLTTAAQLVSTVLVAVFALGAVFAVSADRAGPDATGPVRRPIFARWLDITPAWLVLTGFLFAMVTWDLLYLPLLLPAMAAAFQFTPERLDERLLPRLLLLLGLLAGYGWLVLPTMVDAWDQRDVVALLLFGAPPLLACAVAGPLPRSVLRPLAPVSQTAVLVVLGWAALPVITTPVLPLTVATVSAPSGSSEDVRWHVVAVDDVHMTILEARGGVRFVPVDRDEAQVLCPNEDALPRHRLRVHDSHVEDSLLEGLGRRVRPVHRVDAACRTPV